MCYYTWALLDILLTLVFMELHENIRPALTHGVLALPGGSTDVYLCIAHARCAQPRYQLHIRFSCTPRASHQRLWSHNPVFDPMRTATVCIRRRYASEIDHRDYTALLTIETPYTNLSKVAACSKRGTKALIGH